MFKPKKKKTEEQSKEEPVQEEIEDEVEEDIEDELEEEIEDEAPAEEGKPQSKSSYKAGDIIPIQDIIGYNVVKKLNKFGQPIVISTEKLSEAEILSFIYKS